MTSNTSPGGEGPKTDKFLVFAFAACDMVAEVGNDGCIMYASGPGGRLLDRNMDDLKGREWVSLFQEHDRKFIRFIFKKMSSGMRYGPIAVKLENGTDEGVDAVFNVCQIKDVKHCTLGMPSTLSTKLLEAAKRDESTGLLDKESFGRSAAIAMESAKAAGKELKLTLIDMEEFDEFSQRVGKDRTEEFLSTFGAMLRTEAADGSSAGALAEGKYGVIQDVAADVSKIHTRIKKLSASVDPDGTGLSVSQNVVDLKASSLTQQEVNRALVYVVNKFAQFGSEEFGMKSLDDGCRDLVTETVNKITNLKGIVGKGKFEIVFQPIVHIKSRKVHHFEVLARLEDGKSPFEMVTFAENVGIIEEFDLAVCDKSIKYLMDQRCPTGVELAVNISGRSVQSEIFVQSLMKMLEMSGVDKRRLMFEITESSEITDITGVDKSIQCLRKLGYKVCLDDFGAGAASFQYLRGLDVDFIKIDGLYVKMMMDSHREASIIKAMAGLCQDIGVGIIAEMVENEEQAARLVSLGVEYAQGWLFGKPEKKPVGYEKGRTNVPVGTGTRDASVRETWM